MAGRLPTTLPALVGLLALALPGGALAAERDTEPVVLTGADLPGWAVPANQTAKLPLLDLPESGGCALDESTCDSHNDYAEPEVDTSQAQEPGPPVERFLAYRWNGSEFEQIRFQVDEVFTRYLDNGASGFAFFSGQDQHTTYAYDREGFRWWGEDPANPCIATPASKVATDPIAGLDANDELAFMAEDAGPAAPADAALPAGIEDVRAVRVADPTDPEAQRFVYLMRAREDGPRPAFDASNGYVKYQRDANANVYELSESSYEGYGNARVGTYCDAEGNPVGEGRRRPRDYAWIETDRYRFRYDGRWLMTRLHVSEDGGQTYGPDIVDRWKARAFAQDAESETPCCGYEEEDTNWGGSSTLLGERVGPVRAIRETWGADSGTNVIRRETFYREEVRLKNWLRVHVIPPLDGIYAQWDFNAGRITRFYNAQRPEGVAVDGRNDEMYGNFDDPCNQRWDVNETSQADELFRLVYQEAPLCELAAASPGDYYHQSVDAPDLTFSDANAALGWSQVSGPHGTLVMRQSAQAKDLTPGGAIQSAFAVPYYRDDSCFDDGTGSDPGPNVAPRTDPEPMTTSAGLPRRCWTEADGLPDGSDTFFQGSIGTHGLHVLFIIDSDNARQTVPLTEMVAENRMVVLPGDPGNVGEDYGRSFEQPLVPVVTPFGSSGADGPGSEPTPPPPPAEQPPPPPPAAPAPPPADEAGSAGATASSGRLTGYAARRIAVRRGRFRALCEGSGTNCGVTVLVRTSRGLKEIGAGTAAFENGKATVHVKMFSIGRRMLARRRSGMPVVLHFQATEANGATTTFRKRARLYARR